MIRTSSFSHRVYEAKTGQSRSEFRQDERVGFVSVKVPERAFELFQLGWRQVGHVPRYNLPHVSIRRDTRNSEEKYALDCQ
jgi:hypothetical protein